jgi:predicted MFS family arabinose efflux permease
VQAVVNSGTGAGVVVGGLLVLAVPDAWRPAWVVFAVVSLLVTWWADRCSRWPSADRPARAPAPLQQLVRPLVAAVLAGAGCASVWTFGRGLMTGDGGLPDGTTGLLWCVLGAAGLVGGLSGDLVQRVGLRRAWTSTAAVTAAAVLLLAALPHSVVAAAAALAVFGCAFVVLTGVLIAWGAHRLPAVPAQAAAVLFTGLTVGQSAGALVLGAVADATSTRVAFVVAAALVLVAAPVAEPRLRPAGALGSRRRSAPPRPSTAPGPARRPRPPGCDRPASGRRA